MIAQQSLYHTKSKILIKMARTSAVNVSSAYPFV